MLICFCPGYFAYSRNVGFSSPSSSLTVHSSKCSLACSCLHIFASRLLNVSSLVLDHLTAVLRRQLRLFRPMTRGCFGSTAWPITFRDLLFTINHHFSSVAR